MLRSITGMRSSRQFLPELTEEWVKEAGYAPVEENAPPMDKGPIRDIKEGPRPSMRQ